MGASTPQTGTSPGVKPRVIVSSDIGGTDPDDIQSMVHFLLYADRFDVEGIISSPWGVGRREHILAVIDRYASDFPALKTHSPSYPAPDALRALSKQGATNSSTGTGVRGPTEGSEWIVRCARRPDPRPLWVLVWGGIDDLAQALHDAPDILPKLRVYFIGGPNKMFSVDAYDYIETQHPSLWMIEANSSYRGWFVGGDQSNAWNNATFAAAHAKGRGSLGEYFAGLLGGVLKMGDSPSVGYVLGDDPSDPDRGGWGGRFVPVWDGRKTIFTRITTAADQAEAFGVVEFHLPVPPGLTAAPRATMMIDGRIPAVGVMDGGHLRFRFSPRDAKVWPYTIESDLPTFHGLRGEFTAVLPPPDQTARRARTHPNWWSDDPDPAAAEGIHRGARNVSRWRVEFLRDFAERLARTTPRPQVRWGPAVLQQQPAWYGSAEAHAVADSVIQYQSPQGGWPKSTDLAVPPRSAEDIPPPGGGRANSLDNDATTLPMQFLARVAQTTGEVRYREAVARGIDYLLAAQYPNGGWPQFFPLRNGYYSRITFNDDAMVRVLSVLRDAAAGQPPYGFVDENRRARAAAAVARGVDCILRTQITQGGRVTAWAAQYDEQTLAPAWARSYEPPSLSGSESVGIVRFLMSLDHPTPAVVAAVQGAVRWFGEVAIHGVRVEEVTDAHGRKDRRVVTDAAAAPLWARFYELGTNRPIFLGRDSVVRYVFSEVEAERRGGYNYYGTWPATLLAEEYPRWREAHGSPMKARLE